jgi:hypothetical protein
MSKNPMQIITSLSTVVQYSSDLECRLNSFTAIGIPWHVWDIYPDFHSSAGQQSSTCESPHTSSQSSITYKEWTCDAYQHCTWDGGHL